jgi:hypothetical protein
MAIFYIQIPCYVTKGRPERAMTADRHLVVPIEAESPSKAIERLQAALIALTQTAAEPREIG